MYRNVFSSLVITIFLGFLPNFTLAQSQTRQDSAPITSASSQTTEKDGQAAEAAHPENSTDSQDLPLLSLAEIASAQGPIEGELDYLAARWDKIPSVIVLDMKDFATQDQMFSRLAFFLEKNGYRGRLMRDDELAALHGWNAHDYGPAGLASFFGTAERKGFPLDKAELELRDLALKEGLIIQDGKSYSPGKGAILSISRESDRYARRLLLAHESYHGIFFTDPEYRKFCYTLWDDAESTEKHFMRRLLTYLGYDPDSRELTVNEFQAYLLQQPSTMLEAYIRRMQPILAKNPNFVTPAADDALPGIQADEKKLDSFLAHKYKIRAGGAFGASPKKTGN